jgi:circadian clock protein KaiC
MKISSTVQPTGITTFDAVLKGGIPVGSTILVAGQSGAGKTMFCTHWLFAGMQQFNEKGLYISLTEPIAKLLHHQSKASYFSQSDLDNQNVIFADLRTVLEHENLDEGPIAKGDIERIIKHIADMVIENGVKRVVIDSITALCYRLDQVDIIRHFIFSLGTTLAYLDATVLLTSEVQGEKNSVFGTEEFICDGIFRFGYNNSNQRVFQVVKLRGHEYDTDQIKFMITQDGIKLYPTPHEKCEETRSENRCSFGITGIDDMTHGGFAEGSAVAISGPTGAGKTVLALHAAAAALKNASTVLFLSFDQSKQTLTQMAAAFGFDFSVPNFHVVSPPVDERYIDAHIFLLKEAVDKGGVNTIVIDSLTALQYHYGTDEVLSALKKLVAYCKNAGVSLIVTNTLGSFLQNSTEKVLDCSAIVDTTLLLRFVEIDNTLRTGLMVQKMRFSEHEKRMMELLITQHGALITNGFSEYDSVMSGKATRASKSAIEKLHSLFLEEFGVQGDQLFIEQQAIGTTQENVLAFMSTLRESGVVDEDQYGRMSTAVQKLYG